MTRVSNPEGSKAGPLLYITVLNRICANGCVKQPITDALMPDEPIAIPHLVHVSKAKRNELESC
jgi:hypothetical protein